MATPIDNTPPLNADIPMLIRLGLCMPSISRSEMALELGLPVEPLEPLEPPDTDPDGQYEYKQLMHEWKQQYYETIERDYDRSYEAEWRIRLRWARAALFTHAAGAHRA